MRTGSIQTSKTTSPQLTPFSDVIRNRKDHQNLTEQNQSNQQLHNNHHSQHSCWNASTKTQNSSTSVSRKQLHQISKQSSQSPQHQLQEKPHILSHRGFQNIPIQKKGSIDLQTPILASRAQRQTSPSTILKSCASQPKSTQHFNLHSCLSSSTLSKSPTILTHRQAENPAADNQISYRPSSNSGRSENLSSNKKFHSTHCFNSMSLSISGSFAPNSPKPSICSPTSTAASSDYPLESYTPINPKLDSIKSFNSSSNNNNNNSHKPQIKQLPSVNNKYHLYRPIVSTVKQPHQPQHRRLATESWSNTDNSGINPISGLQKTMDDSKTLIGGQTDETTNDLGASSHSFFHYNPLLKKSARLSETPSRSRQNSPQSLITYNPQCSLNKASNSISACHVPNIQHSIVSTMRNISKSFKDEDAFDFSQNISGSQLANSKTDIKQQAQQQQQHQQQQKQQFQLQQLNGQQELTISSLSSKKKPSISHRTDMIPLAKLDLTNFTSETITQVIHVATQPEQQESALINPETTTTLSLSSIESHKSSIQGNRQKESPQQHKNDKQGNNMNNNNNNERIVSEMKMVHSKIQQKLQQFQASRSSWNAERENLIEKIQDLKSQVQELEESNNTYKSLFGPLESLANNSNNNSNSTRIPNQNPLSN